MRNWYPNYMFNHFSEITDEWVKEHNVKYILSDLDGTLAGWNEPAKEIFSTWLNIMKKNEVELIIVSNNHGLRVEEFAITHQIQGLSNCNKPNSRKIDKLIALNKLDKTKTLFLGDQVFTDVWCGNKLKVRTALITKPLGDIEPFRTSCKRDIEKIVLKNRGLFGKQ